MSRLKKVSLFHICMRRTSEFEHGGAHCIASKAGLNPPSSHSAITCLFLSIDCVPKAADRDCIM